MGLFRKISKSIIHFTYRCIANLWVAPLEKVASRLEHGRQSWFRELLYRSAFWHANVGRAIVMNLRLTVKLWTGENWSALYIGDGMSINVIKHYLFPTLPQEEELPREFLWKVPALIKKYSQKGNLTVCELNPIIHYPFMDTGLSFSIPPWIHQVLEEIDRPIDYILADMNQTMRRNIRRLESQGFSYVFSKNQDDFDSFYHHMHLPYIQRRFSELDMIIMEYDSILKRFQRGGLILIKQNQIPVCGMICIWENDCLYAQEMGVLDGEFDLVKQGSNVALWWFMLDFARKQEVVRFDFGSSHPLIVDGVFNFKRQYGTRVREIKNVESRWSFYSQDLSVELRQYINQLGLVVMLNNEGFRVLLPDESGSSLGRDDFSPSLKEAANYGLAGLMVVTRGSKTIIRVE